MNAMHWSLIAAGAGVIGWAVFATHRADAEQVTRLDAFAACEGAVRDASGHAAAVVPFVEPIEAGQGWIVVWPERSGLRVTQHGGVESTGACLVTGGRVQRLVIDEQRIIEAFVRVAATS